MSTNVEQLPEEPYYSRSTLGMTINYTRESFWNMYYMSLAVLVFFELLQVVLYFSTGLTTFLVIGAVWVVSIPLTHLYTVKLVRDYRRKKGKEVPESPWKRP